MNPQGSTAASDTVCPSAHATSQPPTWASAGWPPAEPAAAARAPPGAALGRAPPPLAAVQGRAGRQAGGQAWRPWSHHLLTARGAACKYGSCCMGPAPPLPAPNRHVRTPAAGSEPMPSPPQLCPAPAPTRAPPAARQAHVRTGASAAGMHAQACLRMQLQARRPLDPSPPSQRLAARLHRLSSLELRHARLLRRRRQARLRPAKQRRLVSVVCLLAGGCG